MRYNRTILIAAALAGLVAASAVASEGRIPISAPGTTLTSPGHYFVTRDLDGGGATVLTIGADGVTVDLNGFTLSDPAADIVVISGAAGASLGVTVRNGRLSGGFAGIYSAAGIRRRLRLEELSIQGTAERGILVEQAEYVSIRRCEVDTTVDAGIEILGGSAAFRGEIVGNRVSSSQSHGIYLFGLEAGEVRDNRVSSSGLAAGATSGIVLDGNPAWDAGGNRIVDNSVSGHAGTQYGIFISAAVDENLVRGNVVRGSAGLGGLSIDSESPLILENTLVGNSGSGIVLAGIHPLLELNQIAGNAAFGIVCGGSQVGAYRNNMLRGNASGAIDAGSCTLTTDAGGNIP